MTIDYTTLEQAYQQFMVAGILQAKRNDSWHDAEQIASILKSEIAFSSLDGNTYIRPLGTETFYDRHKRNQATKEILTRLICNGFREFILVIYDERLGIRYSYKTIDQLTKLGHGDPVTYKPNGEIGIIKSLSENRAFVVFKCNEDWDNYSNYTAQATHPEKLTYGWNATTHPSRRERMTAEGLQDMDLEQLREYAMRIDANAQRYFSNWMDALNSIEKHLIQKPTEATNT